MHDRARSGNTERASRRAAQLDGEACELPQLREIPLVDPFGVAEQEPHRLCEPLVLDHEGPGSLQYRCAVSSPPMVVLAMGRLLA